MAESNTGHPKGLYLLFFTEMWERFSYYGMRALLILYMTKALMMDKALSSNIYGNYTSLVYLTPLLGGYIADRYWGNRKSILVGGILMALGQLALFFSGHFYTEQGLSLNFFYAGLGLLILGNGFFKPNISTMVGSLYAPNDRRKDAAFTIFYMGINLGAFFAPLVCGALGETGDPADFKWGFLAAGVGMVIGIILFESMKNKYIVTSEGVPIGMVPAKKDMNPETTLKDEPLTRNDWERIAVIFILAVFVIAFWSAFEQAGASLTFFADEQTNRDLFGWTMPASYFQSVNPIAIFIFAPLFAWLWVKLGARGKEPSSPLKMAIGLMLLSLGYVVIAAGVKGVDDGVKISMLWLLGMYVLHTFGELCVSPIGLSMVTKLAPIKFASLLMGVWFLSNAASNKLAGVLSGLYPPGAGEAKKAAEAGIDLNAVLNKTLNATDDQLVKLKDLSIPHEWPSLFGYQITTLYDFFMIFVVMSAVASIILFLTYRQLLKMMHGRD
jgi:POT family proton-dependent oligopeptide transporter